MSREQSNSMHPKEAQEIYQAGIEEMDRLLIGELGAKTCMLVMLAAGENRKGVRNSLLIGPPGGGKTVLATNFHRLIEGMEGNDVLAFVPPMSDLQPQQLVGGETKIRKEVVKDGKNELEVISTAVKALVNSQTRGVVVNEVNRVNPLATNAIFDALEHGVITTTEGVSQVPNLMYGVFTMNPSASMYAKHNTFNMDPALASRMSAGAVLGNEDLDARQQRFRDIFERGWKPQPEQMSPVMDVNQLTEVRRLVHRKIVIPGDIGRYAVGKYAHVDSALRDHHIHEGDGRLAEQASALARAHAAWQGQDRVTEHDVNLAFRLMITGRLGMLSTGETYEKITDTVEQVVDS